MSTINTFLPHNDRGPSGSNRRLVHSLAELLIWARTSTARQHGGFQRSLEQLSAVVAEEGGEKEKAEALVQRMQTVIRRLRKEMSAHAREQGFALCTQYTLDPTSVSLKMLKRGKVGDLQMLRRLAGKAGDTRLLQLLAKRNAETGRAQPFNSVGEMMRGWIPLNLGQVLELGPRFC